MECKMVSIIMGIILCSVMLSWEEKVTVMNCERNEDHDNGSGAWRSDKRFQPLNTFTVCCRFNFKKLRIHNIFAYFGDDNKRPPLELQIKASEIRYVWAWEYKMIFLNESLQPFRWYFFCITYDPEDTTLTTFLDGTQVHTDQIKLLAESSGKNLTLGYRETWKYKGISFIGNLTQFNMWKRILTAEELLDLSHCKENIVGDFISWNDSQWNYNDVDLTDVELTDLCQKKLGTKIWVIPPMMFSQASYVCEGVGGKIPLPTKDSYEQLFKKALAGSDKVCTSYWIGAWDEVEEGIWRKHKDDEILTNLPWGYDEPNGIIFENCASLRLDGTADDNCDSNLCGLCSLSETQVWTFHGSCEEIEHNMMFFLTISEENEWHFQGYQYYSIYKNPRSKSWLWVDKRNNISIGELRQSKYPFGRRLWHLFRPMCGRNDAKKMMLLTTCSNDQFSCNDGTCIEQHKRCDFYNDCGDESDEVNCILYKVPSDYKKNIPPRDSSNTSILQISTSIDLESLLVDTNEMLLHITFNLTMSWKEGRAIYYNLKDNILINKISAHKNTLWNPSVAFKNTKKEDISTVDDLTKTVVQKVRKSSRRDLSLSETVALYSGRYNPIISHRKYQASFTCEFDLTRYPFDTQTCFMDLRHRSATSRSLIFHEESSTTSYRGALRLTEYEVGNISLKTYIKDDYSGLKIKIPLKRLQGDAFINVYIPSSTVLVIGYSTLFYKKNMFEVRIMTALTSLLVIVTLFTEVGSSLPKTSYFKLVDIWLLFCIFTTSFVLFFHILIDSSVNRSMVKSSVMIGRTYYMEKLGRFVIALEILIFNMIYWGSIYL